MKTSLTLILTTFIYISVFAQQKPKVFTSDIDNFWVAYDSIQQTKDLSRQIQFINELYISKGTKGLRAFMKARNYNDTLWVKLINKLPKFWQSIRPNTLNVKNKVEEIEKAITHLKKLYPNLKEAEIYFTIGGLRSGGTVKNNMVLVGCEIATGDKTTDVSEFTNSWLKNVFREQSVNNIVSLNTHEYVHTQQKGNDKVPLLSQCIREGSCDFIAELAIQSPLSTKYLLYGKAHADSVKQQFKNEMFLMEFSNWLYNGSQKGESADLGYYVGYEICKAYYKQSRNKSKAIKEIIELDYANEKEVEDFLDKSGYYDFTINKDEILSHYQSLMPYIIGIGPFDNNSRNVPNNLKELKVTFSKPMFTENYSINYSEKGKDYFPIKGIKGFENDDKTLILHIDLQANREYEFVISNKSFKSREGYKLKDENYIVKFKTL
jgi:hypothetical protein